MPAVSPDFGIHHAMKPRRARFALRRIVTPVLRCGGNQRASQRTARCRGLGRIGEERLSAG